MIFRTTLRDPDRSHPAEKAAAAAAAAAASAAAAAAAGAAEASAARLGAARGQRRMTDEAAAAAAAAAQGASAPVVHLNWLLRASCTCFGDAEAHYQQAPGVMRFIKTISSMGLVMAAINFGLLLRQHGAAVSGSGPPTGNMAVFVNRRIMQAFLLVALAELAVLHRCWAGYARARLLLSIANRLARIAFYVRSAAVHGQDLMGTWQAVTKPRPLLALAGYTCIGPFLLLQSTVNFPLPYRAALPLQLLSAVAGVWASARAPATMRSIEQLQSLAEGVCSRLHGGLELTLQLALAAVPPALPAAGLATLGWADACGPHKVHQQLLVFADLMLMLFLPLFVLHALELHHKASFWSKAGARVRVQCSVFVPLPGRLLLGHALVLAAAPPVLWLAAELLVDVLLCWQVWA